MMDFDDEEKEAGEILRSLLSTPKMQSSQQYDVNYWHQTDGNFQSETTYQSQEQMVWQIESNNSNKPQFFTNNHNIVQHIPVTYLTTDNRNLAFGNARSIKKPVTYVLSRNVVAETPKYCTIDGNEGNIILNEPQKIVLVQEVASNAIDAGTVYNDVSGRMFRVQENETETDIRQPEYQYVNNDKIVVVNSSSDIVKNEQVCDGDKNEKIVNAVNKVKKKRKLESDSSATITSRIIREGSHPTKSKVEKKISSGKKPLKKRKKNSKMKSKVKTVGGKPLVKKPKKNVKTVEYDEEGDDKLDGDKSKGNLFELTKLEDNAEQVAERFKIGCECSDSNCFDGLNPENVFKHRLNIADLTKAEHDMYLMGVIMASIQNPEETCRHKERIRIRSCYAYQGKKVCLTAFLYLQHVTLYQMKRLRSHLKYHGVSPRIHGNHGRKPANTLSLDIYRRATNFVQNYIEKHCIKSVPNFTTFSSNKIGSTFLSGSSLNLHDAKNGKKVNKIKVANKMTSYHLPPECTKKTVHKEYKSFCESLKPSQKVMQYSTFTNFLKKQFPNVKFQKLDKKQEEKCQPEAKVCNSEEIDSKQKIKKTKKIGDVSDSDKNGDSVDKYVQTSTQVYIPAKTVHITQPTLIMAPKAPNPQVFNRTQQLVAGTVVKSPQIILNGQHIQFYSGGSGNELQTDFRFPNQVLVGNQIYSAQCENSQSSGSNTQQIYAMDNMNN